LPSGAVRLILAALLSLPACAAPIDDEGDAEDAAFLAGGKADELSAAEAAAVLALVNRASFEELDDGARLDSRAADAIVSHRDGGPGPDDDDPIDDLAELDAIPWVGPVAFERLRLYAGAAGCLIISEYFELWGQYNKTIELFNCGAAEVDLADYSICLVRNDDDGCTVTQDLGESILPAGGVTTVCREKSFHPAGLDPVPVLAEGCDLERPGAMVFSGDDRLLVLGQAGAIADSLGRVGYRPPESTWSNTVLQRCNLTPADGTSFYDTGDYFRRLTAADYSSWGVAPVAGCD
jgi:hypothetical protein